MTNLNRDELKELAVKNGIEFPKNIKTEVLLNRLIDEGLLDENSQVKENIIKEEPDEQEKISNKKPKTPNDCKKVKCVIRNLDPKYPMDVVEVGVNGYFMSAFLDKEIEISEYFIPSIKAIKYDKAILDDNDQVKEIRMMPRFTVEML